MMHKGRSRTIGNYTTIGVLGHGSMGSVYRAISPSTGKTVALKALNHAGPLSEFIAPETLREIFIQEIRTMSRFDHPNIAEVIESDCDKKKPFFIMEYFCNNLGSLIGENFIVEDASRRVPPDKAVDYGCQVLAGLQCMHDSGVVHRDIKPFNLMLSDHDTVKICDFGMAKPTDGQFYGVKGMNVGTPYYTAPEQISNPDNADSRSDLYSTGVLLYRMITGELPAMKSFMLSRIDRLYDQNWDAFFARALSWKPELRFQNAREMADELLQLELHWNLKEEGICRKGGTEVIPGKRFLLRSSPIRVSGFNARKNFEVDHLWQPTTYIDNTFKLTEKNTVLDESTRLIWQQASSEFPMDRQSADEFIDVLNEIHSHNIACWRLPTVNELLSLVSDPALTINDSRENPCSAATDWFWSCDRRSRDTSWYVNTRLGYTGWQNNSCLYGVRAVATMR